jgi:hypothetical protein
MGARFWTPQWACRETFGYLPVPVGVLPPCPTARQAIANRCGCEPHLRRRASACSASRRSSTAWACAACSTTRWRTAAPSSPGAVRPRGRAAGDGDPRSAAGTRSSVAAGRARSPPACRVVRPVRAAHGRQRRGTRRRCARAGCRPSGSISSRTRTPVSFASMLQQPVDLVLERIELRRPRRALITRHIVDMIERQTLLGRAATLEDVGEGAVFATSD